MNYPKKDLGYRTDEILFSVGTVMGLFDSDGSYILNIHRSGRKTKKYAIQVTFFQTEENKDVAESLRNTIDSDGRIYQVRGQEKGEGERKPGVSLVYNFVANEALRQNWLYAFPPLLPGKRRDFLIAEILMDHRKSGYRSFRGFDFNSDLKRRNIFISFDEICNLSLAEKRTVGEIACLYLRYNASPKINLAVKERKQERLNLEDAIKSLDPSASIYSLGKRLGKYFLLDVNKQVKDLDRLYRYSSFTVPDDYLVGLFIGDGGLEFRLRFNPQFNTNFRFSITASRDSRSLLESIQRKIGAGVILDRIRDSQYSLDATGPLRNKVILLLSQYPMSYSKQRQLNIVKELFVFLDQGKYKNKQDLFEVIDLWDELRSLHKVRGQITKEQKQQEALNWLRANNYI